jgi:hypothetical protein
LQVLRALFVALAMVASAIDLRLLGVSRTTKPRIFQEFFSCRTIFGEPLKHSGDKVEEESLVLPTQVADRVFKSCVPRLIRRPVNQHIFHVGQCWDAAASEDVKTYLLV